MAGKLSFFELGQELGIGTRLCVELLTWQMKPASR
jgi:hypothetical protein